MLVLLQYPRNKVARIAEMFKWEMLLCTTPEETGEAPPGYHMEFKTPESVADFCATTGAIISRSPYLIPFSKQIGKYSRPDQTEFYVSGFNPTRNFPETD